MGPSAADLIISSLDSIQKQPPWAVALAEVMREEWCSSHKSAKARLATSLQVLLEKKTFILVQKAADFTSDQRNCTESAWMLESGCPGSV